jgi:hypothetical protein
VLKAAMNPSPSMLHSDDIHMKQAAVDSLQARGSIQRECDRLELTGVQGRKNALSGHTFWQPH